MPRSDTLTSVRRSLDPVIAAIPINEPTSIHIGKKPVGSPSELLYAPLLSEGWNLCLQSFAPILPAFGTVAEYMVHKRRCRLSSCLWPASRPLSGWPSRLSKLHREAYTSLSIPLGASILYILCFLHIFKIGPELLQSKKMRVETAAAYFVASRLWN